MDENIKSKFENEEEEEEEEDDIVVNVRHHRFVYKVQSVKPPGHQTTPLTIISQNASTPAPNPSDEISTEIIDSNVYTKNESLFSKNTEFPLPETTNRITNRTQNPVPTITLNEGDQFSSSFEVYPDTLNYQKEYEPEQQTINWNESIQQLNNSYDGNLFSNGVPSDSANYNFNPDFNTSFGILENLEGNATEILLYNEMITDVLDQGEIQTASLFGSATDNLFNLANSAFDSLSKNIADNVKQAFTDSHNSGNQVIMGLTQDGQAIVDSICMSVSKKLDSNEQNESSLTDTMNFNQGSTFLPSAFDPLGKIIADNIKQAFTDGPNSGNQVIMGLTQDGQAIVDSIRMSVSKKLDSNEQNESSLTNTMNFNQGSTFLPSAFDSLGKIIVDNIKQADGHNSGNQVIMGLTQDGQAIVDSIRMSISKKLDSNEQNESSLTNTMNFDQGNTFLPMSQILNISNEQQHTNSNAIVAGLTANSEFIIANITESNSRVAKHLLSVIMGLTATGQIICNGCVSDITSENLLITSEKTIDWDEYHDDETFEIIESSIITNQRNLFGSNAYNALRDSF